MSGHPSVQQALRNSYFDARASEYAGPADDAAARFVAHYAECLKGFMRGQHRQARETAEAFLRDAEADGRSTEAGVARRFLGLVLLQLGDLQAARNVLERALGDYIRERDRETLFRFGNDTQVSATNFLALTEWHLGEFERARGLTDGSTRLAAELGHVAAIASALFFKTVIESRRGDVPAARLGAESLLAFGRGDAKAIRAVNAEVNRPAPGGALAEALRRAAEKGAKP